MLSMLNVVMYCELYPLDLRPIQREKPMKTSDLKKRLKKDRPMMTINLNIPEDVVQDLQRIAPSLGFSNYEALIRAYI